ncbi:MAG: holo-ACP synthase [Gammaproteobacteria bacterium]|nr:holo-ACP synthase [Gammaproteobacteria bacterium]
MIHGIGTDIVEIERIKDGLERHGERFARRILSAGEYATYLEHSNPQGFLAKRFAAKEATAKALGTGFRDGLSLQHIEVVNDDLGKPQLVFHGAAQDLVAKLGVGEAHISLSDERHYAVAYVVLTSARV